MKINLRIQTFFLIPTLITFTSLTPENQPATNVVMQTEKFDATTLPPTAMGLVKEESEAKEKKQLKDIEQIFSKVTKSSDDEMEVEAEKLVKDKDKLDGFLSSVINKMSRTETKETANQPAITKEVKALLEKQYTAPELTSQKISFAFKRVSISEIISLINKLSGLKIVVDGDTESFATNVNLKDVSIANALQILLDCSSPRLALLQIGDIWRVTRLSNAVEHLSLQVQTSEAKDLHASFFTTLNARWDDAFKARIEKLWQGISGISKNGIQSKYLVFDDNSHKIFFRGSQEQIDALHQILNEIDVHIPQIKIEARVIIASKDFDETLGVQWNGIYNQNASVKHVDFVGVGPITKGISPLNPAANGTPLNWAMNFLPALSNVINTAAGIKIPFIFGNSDLVTKRLNLTLTAAENRREIKTILKPCLLVNNEETAEILSGQQMPQQVRITETVSGDVSNLSTTSYKDIGMKIRVKPIVSSNMESVFLDIYVENSSVGPTSVPAGYVAETQNKYSYTILTASSKNRVLLKSGQTTLIGGLITSSQEYVETGVPGLKNIPVVGWLFKGKAKKLEDKQLLIFITPTLV